MRPFRGSLIHAGGVLIKVDSFICDSTLKDKFPTSLWAPLHTMWGQQKTGCVTLSMHVTGVHRSPTGGHSLPCMVVCTEVHSGNMAMEQVPRHPVAP